MQATTTNMVGELDSRLSAKVADLLAQLQHSDEDWGSGQSLMSPMAGEVRDA